MNNKPRFKTLDQKSSFQSRERDNRENREPREFRDRNDRRDSNRSNQFGDKRPYQPRERDNRENREPREFRDRNDRRDSNRSNQFGDKRPYQPRERDNRENREPREFRDRNDRRDSRDFQDNRRRDDRRDFRDNRPFQREEKTIYPTEGKRVGLQSGTVKISVKGSEPAEKKTGPLSPRAPEKIRKNRSEEMKIYGENACLTLFQQRPDAIVRLWATVEMSHRLGEVLSHLAEQKKAYHIVDSEELALVTGTEHHGGICLLVKKALPFSLEGYLQVPRTQDCLVLLDNVNNAQNIGGVVRTCAFYGVSGIVVESSEQLNSSNTARVAEGGLEFVKALETKHKQIALTQLRNAGYQIVHLTRNKQASHLVRTALSAKVVFVLSEIVPQEVDESQDTVVQLSFTNPLQSGLNVAVSSGVLLAHWYQQHAL